MEIRSYLTCKKYLLAFCFVIPFFSAFSQNMHIEGTVIDTNQNSNVAYVKMILVNLRDSVITAHQTTDKDGHFQFDNIPIDTFRLIVEHPRYETREFYFFGTEDNSLFVLDGIVMSDRGKKIEEITIFAYKDPVYYKGDTLVYVADSFKTRPNAVVEDLLKRLPGITVESDGSIKSQGKNVARVYVDGDEFFGSDATLATKNLSASSVETVQVYETTLPDSDITDEKVQVIDLKLKDEAKKGYFGEASFGTDFSRFYEGKLLANKFNKKQKISVYFLSGNTTKSSLSWNDANQYGIDQGNAYNYNAETDSWEVNDNFMNTDDGFPLVFKTGVYYTDQVTKKLKVGANYSYSDYRKMTEETSRSTFFLPDTTYSNHTNNRTNTHFKHHEVNMNFRYDIDSSQFITFDPKFNYSTRNNNYLQQSDFLNSNGNLTRNASTNNTSESDATNIKTRIGYTKNFKKEKRQLVVFNNFIYDQSNTESGLLYTDYFAQTGLTENGIDQQKNGDKTILSNVFSVTYTEPLSKKLKLQFTYELYNNTNTRNTRSYNNQNGVYDELDSLTSGDFKSIKFQNKLGASLFYDFKKHTIGLGIFGRNVSIDNQNQFLGTTINQNETNILPRLTYQFRINQNSSLRFTSQTTSILPDINLLQPIQDNSNPNSIMTGNQGLRPNYAINTNANYNTYNPLSGGYFYGGFYSEYGFNQFISTMNYDAIGRIENSYVNGNTLNYLGTYGGGAIPLIKQVFTLDPSFGYTYGNRYSYVNGERNALTTHTLETGLELQLYTDVVEFGVGGTYALGQNLNSISPELDLTNNTYGLNADLRVYLPWNMEVATDFNYNKYSNLSEEFNINTFIWNASIEQNLGKNKNWGIAVNANDILNQNTRISRTAFANRVTDSRTAIIARYFMFSLSYKFNSTFKKTTNTDTNEEGQ